MSSSPSFTPFADLAASAVPHLGFADVPRVRAILAAEGIPAARLENLALVFTNAATDDMQVRALVARARTEVPELFAPPAPLPATDAAHLLAEARGWSADSPERQSALARKLARDDAEAAAMARLGQIVGA